MNTLLFLSLQNSSCLINGYCFAPNETNPIDWCYQCLPQNSTKAWSKRQGNYFNKLFHGRVSQGLWATKLTNLIGWNRYRLSSFVCYDHCLIRLTVKTSYVSLSLVNLPPGFSPTTQYYAVFKETLELIIDVVDPEGMPVTLSLMDGSTSKAMIVRDNVLIWNATNDANTQFFLKATDACRATSYLNITVSLLACQCQNNASCVPHPNKPRGSGFYECQCVPGYTGIECENNIDDCQSYPCLRGNCDGCFY